MIGINPRDLIAMVQASEISDVVKVVLTDEDGNSYHILDVKYDPEEGVIKIHFDHDNEEIQD